jgi:NAD(P)-dependent dehydrogenase (short-subunit alcohol dehydrogenase family)
MASPNPAIFCEPLHHNVEGPTDPSNTNLPSPFVVAILGASRGIGHGISSAYAHAGATGIAITGRNVSTLEQRATELRKINKQAKIITIVADVTVENDFVQVADHLRKEFGRLDVLVFNAGTSAKIYPVSDGKKDWPGNLIDASTDEMRTVVETNGLAPWVAAHHLLPLLEETKDGAQAFVVTGSAAAWYTNPQFMSQIYSFSKLMATRVVEHIHEGHKDKGIVSYCLQPGGVFTDMVVLPTGKGWEDSKFYNALLQEKFY